MLRRERDIWSPENGTLPPEADVAPEAASRVRSWRKIRGGLFNTGIGGGPVLQLDNGAEFIHVVTLLAVIKGESTRLPVKLYNEIKQFGPLFVSTQAANSIVQAGFNLYGDEAGLKGIARYLTHKDHHAADKHSSSWAERK